MNKQSIGRLPKKKLPRGSRKAISEKGKSLSPLSKASKSRSKSVSPPSGPSRKSTQMNADDQLLEVHSILKRYKRFDGVATQMANLQLMIDGQDKGELVLAVLGAFSRGKSTFINALLRADAVPTSYLPTTAVYTRLSYGSKPSAELHFTGAEPLRATMEETRKFVATDTARIKGLEAIHIRYPSPYLEAGLDILDAPGIGSVYSEHRAPALRCLAEADVAIFIMASEPLLGQAECEFVREVMREVGRVFFVQTKIDSHKDWLTRLQFNQDALENISGVISPKIYPVSSLRFQAYQGSNDPADLEASGFIDFEQDLNSFLKYDRERAIALKRHTMLRSSITHLKQQLESLIQADRESLMRLDVAVAEQQTKLTINEKHSLPIYDQCSSLLSQFQLYARASAQKASDPVHSAYNIFVNSAAMEDLQTKAAAKVLMLLREAREMVQKDIQHLSRKTIQDIQSVWKTSPTNVAPPRISASINLDSVPDIILNTQIVKTTDSSGQANVGGAVVGGLIGLVLSGFNPMGAAAGAAIGSAIGGSSKDKQIIDIAATRKAYAEAGQKAINDYMQKLRTQLNSDLKDWVNSNQVSIRKQLDLINQSNRNQIEQYIMQLQQESAKIKRHLKQIQADLSRLSDIYGDLSTLKG